MLQQTVASLALVCVFAQLACAHAARVHDEQVFLHLFNPPAARAVGAGAAADMGVVLRRHGRARGSPGRLARYNMLTYRNHNLQHHIGRLSGDDGSQLTFSPLPATAFPRTLFPPQAPADGSEAGETFGEREGASSPGPDPGSGPGASSLVWRARSGGGSMGTSGTSAAAVPFLSLTRATDPPLAQNVYTMWKNSLSSAARSFSPGLVFELIEPHLSSPTAPPVDPDPPPDTPGITASAAATFVDGSSTACLPVDNIRYKILSAKVDLHRHSIHDGQVQRPLRHLTLVRNSSSYVEHPVTASPEQASPQYYNITRNEVLIEPTINWAPASDNDMITSTREVSIARYPKFTDLNPGAFRVERHDKTSSKSLAPGLSHLKVHDRTSSISESTGLFRVERHDRTSSILSPPSLGVFFIERHDKTGLISGALGSHGSSANTLPSSADTSPTSSPSADLQRSHSIAHTSPRPDRVKFFDNYDDMSEEEDEILELLLDREGRSVKNSVSANLKLSKPPDAKTLHPTAGKQRNTEASTTKLPFAKKARKASTPTKVKLFSITNKDDSRTVRNMTSARPAARNSSAASDLAAWWQHPYMALYIYEPEGVHCDAAAVSGHWVVSSGACLMRSSADGGGGGGGEPGAAYVTYCGSRWDRPGRINYVVSVHMHPRYGEHRLEHYNIGAVRVENSMLVCEGWRALGVWSHKLPASTRNAHAVGWRLNGPEAWSRMQRDECGKRGECDASSYALRAEWVSLPGSVCGTRRSRNAGSGEADEYCTWSRCGRRAGCSAPGVLVAGGRLLALWYKERAGEAGGDAVRARYTTVWRAAEWLRGVVRERAPGSAGKR